MSVLLKHTYGISIFLVLSIPCFSTLSLANPVKSSDVLPYGRYLTLKMQSGVEQTDMLSVVIEVHFSPVIKTVGDALNDVLRYSGYSLIDTAKQSPELQNTLKKPLPWMHRDLGPLSLRQALITLAGTPYELRVDTLNRTIDFELKPAFQK